MTESVTEERPPRDDRPWYRRWVPGWRAITVLAVLLLAMPVSVRWYRLWWLPNVPVPFDEEAFNELPAVGLGHDEHAFTHFQRAQMLIKPLPKAPEFWERFAEPVHPSVWDEFPEEARQWVMDGQPVIEHLRRGGRCKSGQILIPRQYNFMVMLPHAQGMRDLQRLSNLDVIRLLHAGETQDAVGQLHDVYRAHRFLGPRGCNIERLIGIACHSVQLRGWQMWCRHPNVTAEDLEAALGRLRQDWKLTPLPSDNFKVEYSSIVNELKYPMTNVLNEFDQSVDRWTIEHAGLSTAPLTQSLSANAKGWQIPILWVAGEPERSQRGARLWLTQMLKTCDLPRAQQPASQSAVLRLPETAERTAGLTAAQLDERIMATLLSAIMPATDQVQRAIWAEAGRQTMLELEMELQILIRRRGLQSREALEAALENYAWPTDLAAADGTPIRHRFTDEGLKLWSLSWDGADQDGTTENQGGRGIDSVTVIPWPSAPLERIE